MWLLINFLTKQHTDAIKVLVKLSASVANSRNSCNKLYLHYLTTFINKKGASQDQRCSDKLHT